MRILYFFLLMLLCSGAMSQSLKVMTYNLRYDNPGDGVNAWPGRKQKVFDLVKKYDPDIIGVQEALRHQLEDITAALSDYVYIGVGRDDGKQKGEYSAILYKKDRFKAARQNTFWLSETPDVVASKSWDAAITRIATWAEFSDTRSGKKFLVVNTHFDHVGKEARIKSAQLLKEKIPAISKNKATILTGDFNFTRDDAPYNELIKHSGVILADPAPENPPGTFCGFEVGKIECRGIDYIFTTRHWQATQYQVIQDNDGKYYPSDHLPVMVTLQIVEP